MSLQVEKKIVELLRRLPLKTLSDQHGELVRVLAGGRNPHSARPVVVQVSQLVRQLLDVLGPK